MTSLIYTFHVLKRGLFCSSFYEAEKWIDEENGLIYTAFVLSVLLAAIVLFYRPHCRSSAQMSKRAL